MKLILITIISILLVSKIKNQTSTKDSVDEFTAKCINTGIQNNPSKEKCTGINLTDDLKCCYVEYSLKDLLDVKTCVPIYDSLSSIKGYKKMLKEAKKTKIICKSQFLKLSLSFVFIILLF